MHNNLNACTMFLNKLRGFLDNKLKNKTFC